MGATLKQMRNDIEGEMMKFFGLLITKRPVCFSVALCSVILVIAGWQISVWIRIAHYVRGYVMGLGNSGVHELHRNVKFGVVLLVINVCATIIYVLVFTYWSIKLTRREMCVHAALIKQKEATEEAERKSKSKSDAVANASHEVRNALAGIVGLIQMCRVDVAPRSKLDDNLKHMESCTNDLYSLLNSILDASKIEAGKMQLEEEEFDLQKLLEDVADLYYPVGMKKGVDVILDLCDGSVENFRHARGDRGKLKQVLSNLLYNSIKFTDNGYVSLRIWARQPRTKHNSHNHDNITTAKGRGVSFVTTMIKSYALCILFCNATTTSGEGEKITCNNGDNFEKNDVIEYIFDVVDTGKGIPKEKQKSVFENYVQVKENAGNKGHLGHGLGLGIVKSIVHLMGGEIGIVDKEIGEKGTCFRFNVFLEIPTSNNSRHDIESQCGSTNPDDVNNTKSACIPTYHSSKEESQSPSSSSSQVVLFVWCKERSKIIKKFFESRGIKVNVVNKGHHQLIRTLTKIKKKLLLQCSGSSGGTTTPSSYYSSSPSSKSKEVPLSTLDNNKCTLLIIIDTSVGSFPEVSRAIVEFHKNVQLGCVKVVWIDNVSAQINEDNKDKLHLPSTDLVMFKPLQGSRLHQALGLLPEFASTSMQGEIEVVIDKEKEEIQEEDEAGPSATQNKPLAGKRILVVEDSPLQHKICSAVISQLGALRSTCNNGEEALQLVSKALKDLHQPPFDYILMDCEMPIMDGFEATRRIKEEGNAMGICIPIIALTAHTEKEEMNKITKAGMDYYLPKPISAPNLLTAIHYVDKSKQQIN